MLNPYRMDSVIITGPNRVRENVVRELHKLKILHIVEHSKSELADIGEPLEAANRLSEMMVRVRALIAALGIRKEETKFKLEGSLPEIRQSVSSLADEVNKNSEQLKRIEELKSKNQAVLNDLGILAAVDVPISAFRPYRSLACFTGCLNSSRDAAYLKDSLSKVTNEYELLEGPAEKKAFIALFVSISHKEDALQILQKTGFAPANLGNLSPDILNSGKNAAYFISKIESQSQKLENLRQSILKKNQRLAGEHKQFLTAAEEFLSVELEKAEAPLRFAATKDAFLVKGWVPAEQLDNAVGRLNKAAKNKIFIHSEPAKLGDKVPVKLNNPNYSKPFEFFIGMYSFPKYNEIDPTFFMFLTFPIFFGFMLGDIGYGIASFALFYFLKKKMPKGAALFNVLLLSSASSIFFGFIYGEFFGLEELGNFHIPNLISRSHSVLELMYIAIGIGVVHVNWGLIAGFINVRRNHGVKHAIFEKGSWFVLQAGIALLVLTILSIGNLLSLNGMLFLGISALIIIVSIRMIVKGEGVRGIIEIPTIFTNTLSYLRLMAIGLSSVSIAVVVNEMAEGFFNEGGFLILAGILVLLIGHVLNIILGLFGSFLHSLRLHYVEFFSKFFHGGAEKYRPFGLREQ